MTQASAESWIEGSRWLNIVPFLQKGAMRYNLHLEILREEKGWLKHFVAYKVSGDSEDILAFKQELNQIMKDYNRS